ncbi:hypothetical protein CHLRE_11g467450v5 [Chlamydomonas reinhardtii]|uniref:S-adenosyl-L-methionine-dependent methyltransferase n=1 Tax=Chlamydomonas reinhardtii TaxID=3055 RepID=A0A2K3D819_CHLRE|nr:uncharacterized protein CHLRE_11g467450v5 [Chlamydomonas reinhardtii]PNW76679.1 hypothetical protein CHLRE_11g467450v5 [Chlamydomonas reinhardtii]
MKAVGGASVVREGSSSPHPHLAAKPPTHPPAPAEGEEWAGGGDDAGAVSCGCGGGGGGGGGLTRPWRRGSSSGSSSQAAAADGRGAGSRGSSSRGSSSGGSSSNGGSSGSGEGEGEGEVEGPPPPVLHRLRRRLSNVQQLWIYPFTHYKPTNQVMLCYRTLFQDLGSRGANTDHLAAAFRDDLMPLRGWVHRNLPALLHINKAVIAGPVFGCPGVMRYLDARTRWLDGVVAAALRGGCQQVVVVAAGYDTRAYRFGGTAAAGGGANGGGANGGGGGAVRWFEVDLPSASASKRALVERTLPADLYPRPTYIAADLSQVSLAEALLGTGGSSSTGNSIAATAGASAAASTRQTGGRDGGVSCGGGCGGCGSGGVGNGGSHIHVKAGPPAPPPNKTNSSNRQDQHQPATTTATATTTSTTTTHGPPRPAQQQASQHAPPQQQAAQHTQQAQHAAFDPALRTLFTVEGLLYYLPPPAVRRLLGSIREVAAPGSLVAFDYLEQDVFAGRRFAAGYETLRLTVANKGEPKRSGLDPEQLPAYLGALGWRLTYAPTPRQVAEELYPHRRWRDLNPVIPPFYRYAVAEAQAAEAGRGAKAE